MPNTTFQRQVFRALALAGLYLLAPAYLFPQTRHAVEDKGFTAFEEFRAGNSERGQLFVFDTSIGFDFNRNVGIDIGAPYLFIRATPNQAIGESHFWDNHWGDPYADVRFSFDNRTLNYATVAAVSVPISDAGPFSTGRFGVDWSNHFDHPFLRFTPFVNAGISNGLLNTRLLARPFRIFESFRSLGFLADAEAGLTFRVTNRVIVGGSYFALQPAGAQKLFAAGGLQNQRPGGARSVSDLTHDRGYSVLIRFNPTRFVYVEPAYVHSTKLDQGAATLTIGLNLREWFGRRH